MSNFIEKTANLYNFVIKNKVTKADLITLSKMNSTKGNVNAMNDIMKGNYNAGFIARTQFFMYLKESPLITEDNIECFFERKNYDETKANKKISQKTIDLLEQLKLLTVHINEISEIQVDEISDLKTLIVDKEKVITDKGGDDKLFQFLKLDTFLQDFRYKIIGDIKSIVNSYSESSIKSALLEWENRSDLEKITDHFSDSANIVGGQAGNSTLAKVERLVKYGDQFKPAFYKEIATLKFYNALAIGLVVFFLEDKKIRYFELYEAFEKLGVFDSSWQKNVASKLDSIDLRLAQMNDQMTALNENFTKIADNTESMANELKTGLADISQRLNLNNILTGITAYQTYRINKNTKPLN
jgi:hypothetical protein